MAAIRPKFARIYLHRDGSRLIIATMQYTEKGFIMEAPGPLSLTKWDDEDLVLGLKTAIERSETVDRELNAAENPSLKVSGEPSLRSFQAAFIQLDVHQATGVYVVDARPDIPWSLMLRTQVPSQASAAEIARAITRIFEACRDRRF